MIFGNGLTSWRMSSFKNMDHDVGEVIWRGMHVLFVGVSNTVIPNLDLALYLQYFNITIK